MLAFANTEGLVAGSVWMSPEALAFNLLAGQSRTRRERLARGPRSGTCVQPTTTVSRQRQFPTRLVQPMVLLRFMSLLRAGLGQGPFGNVLLRMVLLRNNASSDGCLPYGVEPKRSEAEPWNDILVRNGANFHFVVDA